MILAGLVSEGYLEVMKYSWLNLQYDSLSYLSIDCSWRCSIEVLSVYDMIGNNADFPCES